MNRKYVDEPLVLHEEASGLDDVLHAHVLSRLQDVGIVSLEGFRSKSSFQGRALGPSRLAWMHLRALLLPTDCSRKATLPSCLILFPFTISSSFSPIFTSCLNWP